MIYEVEWGVYLMWAGVGILLLNYLVEQAMKDDTLPEEFMMDDEKEDKPVEIPTGGELTDDGYYILHVTLDKVGDLYHAKLRIDFEKEEFLVNDPDEDNIKDLVTAMLSKRWPESNLRIRFYNYEHKE